MVAPDAYQNLRVGTGKFIFGHGAIVELTNEITRLGGKPLLIGGPTTTDLLMDRCGEALAKADIHPVICRHTGACSRSWAVHYAELAAQEGCTVILGVGGGKCLDLAKCASTFGNMDLICVPTSIATCVASSSVCIMYTDAGVPDGSVAMSKEVDVVLADSDLIATAPKRTLAAGIFDSLAKLPEVVHNANIHSYRDCSLEKYICTVNAQAIYDFLMGEGKNVYDNGVKSGRLTDVVLTNLLHTSVVSGFSCGVNQLALAHGFYDFVRRAFTIEAADIMHGELVAIGILMQLDFNGADSTYLDQVRNLMQQMQMPTTMTEVGIAPTAENTDMLVEYLIPATGLGSDAETRLRRAIAQIAL